MVELDLDRIRQAWREAPDAAVIRGLRAESDYPPEVFTFIRDESRRRGIGPEDMYPVDTRLDFPARIARRAFWAALRWTQAHQVVAAAIFAGAVRLGVTPFQEYTGQIHPAVYFALYMLVYSAGVAIFSLPLRSYRMVARVAFGACVGAIGASLMLISWYSSFNALVQGQSATRIAVTLIAAPVTFFFMPSLAVCSVVFVRRRYWPVYPPGHCKKCEYDLRALPIPRCPECGTPFDPPAVTRNAEELS